MTKPEGCSVDGCDRPHNARGWCNMHWQRWHRHGDPLNDRVTSSVDDETLSYTGAHQRVYRRFGAASKYLCVGGCFRIASQWAYFHADKQGEKSSDHNPYSPDPTRYVPMCVSCHHFLDMPRRVAA